jgi:hypothetical protein
MEGPGNTATAAGASASATPTAQCSFAQMRLRVGDSLHLDLPSMVSPKKYSVTLVGWLDGQSVIVTAPRSANVSRLVQPGELVVLRTFSGTNVYAFKTTVMMTPTAPFHYLHLSFPRRVECVAIRSAVRCRLHMPITITHNGEKSDGAILNLGATGALIECAEPLQKDGTLTLAAAFELHGVPVTLEVTAAVRSMKPGAPGSEALGQYGIQFRDLKPNDHLVLGSLVCYQILQDPDNAA